MCGIAGFFDQDFPAAEMSAVLERMTDSIVHRGPDDVGQLIDAPLAMGMRRLSIIDLAGGRQPIFDEQGRFGVVFNGEIYNYRELRKQLQSRGHRFTTDSDTEVIVHLFEDHGPDCLEQLRGMFSLAVWDSHRRELFIARDRLGIKPLYYTHSGGTLVFASEIKALLEHPSVTAELNLAALGDYLSLKYVPAPQTMFAGIQSLPPGHCLTVRDEAIDVRQYWDVSYSRADEPADERECAERLEELLRESVRLRLRSDVPFGAFLSGGVDSSLIVALMSEMLDEPVKTFTVGFHGGDEPDELPHARAVAQQFGCDHHEVIVSGRDFVEHAERVMHHLDQPIADQATIATHLVARLASQHVKMVLTGEGGDELFAGYARYAGEQYSPWFRHLPRPAGAMIRRLLPKLPGMRRAKIALHALTIKDEATRLANWFPLFNDDAKAQLLCAGSGIPRDAGVAVIRQHLAACGGGAPLDRMLYTDTKTWLPDYLLLRGDKLTMANSLEARVPLLDHRLVEFAARLPARMKLNGRVRKYLLKRVAGDLLPASIVDRKKQGFPIPIGLWLRREANEMLHDLLAPQAISRRGLFNAEYIGRLVSQHQSGFADHAALLWGLMSVEMWMRAFIDHTGSSSRSATVAEPLSI